MSNEINWLAKANLEYNEEDDVEYLLEEISMRLEELGDDESSNEEKSKIRTLIKHLQSNIQNTYDILKYPDKNPRLLEIFNALTKITMTLRENGIKRYKVNG